MGRLRAAIFALCAMSALSRTASGALVGTDIGGPGDPQLAGSLVADAPGHFVVQGGGSDVWGQADHFFFAHENLPGNGEIVAKIESLENTNDWAKAGVMIRDCLDPDSVNAFVALTPTQGVVYQGRDTTGGASFYTRILPGQPAPYWVRLVRNGESFAAYSSADGQAWEPFADHAFSQPWSENLHIGLAVTAHDKGKLNRAVFSNVAITALPIQTLTWNEQGNADWAQIDGTGHSHWLDENHQPAAYLPDRFTNAVVASDTVTVTADAWARNLTVQSGAVALAPGQALAITYGLSVAPGASLRLGAGAGISLRDGAVSALSAAGNATLDNFGSLTVSGYDDGGVAGTLTKRGAGTLLLSGAAAAHTLWRIEAGTLDATGPTRLGGATQVTLAGGTLRLSGSPMPGPAGAKPPGQPVGQASPAGPIDMADVAVTVANDSRLVAASDATATFGSLVLAGGTLTAAGAQGGMVFNRTTVAAGATVTGVDAQVNTTWTGAAGLEGNAAAAVLVKTGPADLILDRPGSNLQSAVFDVRQGRLVGVYRGNPLGAAGVNLSGGELLLASASGSDAAFDNAVAVSADSVLTAGAAAGASAGPLAVTLGSAGKPLALEAGTLTVQTGDEYRLQIAGGLSGPGNLHLSRGTVSLSGGTLGRLKLSAGTLSTSGDLSLGSLELAGGTLDLGGRAALLGEALYLGPAQQPGTTSYRVQGGTFQVRGDDLLAALTVTLNGGTVAVGTSSMGNQTGLLWGAVAGSNNTGEFPAAPTHTANLAETEAPIPQNTTHVFTGEFFDADGKVSFRESIDDHAYLKIDGKVEIDNHNWAGWTQALLSLPPNPSLDPGWHSFELRLSNGPGSGGPVEGLAFSLDPGGGDYYFQPERFGHPMTNPSLAALFRSYGVLPGGAAVQQGAASLVVAASTTLHADTTQPAVFGNLTLRGGVTLSLSGAPGSRVSDLSFASGAAVAGNLTVQGRLASSGGVATLSHTGALTLASTSSYQVSLTGAGSDAVATDGNIQLAPGAALSVAFTGASPFRKGAYTLLGCSGGGALTGTFAYTNSLGKYVDQPSGGLMYTAGALTLTILKDLHPGDANLDTKTDISDLNIWNQYKFKSDTNWTRADFTGNGKTDVGDFNIWMKSRFTAAADAISGAAPPQLVYDPQSGKLSVDTRGRDLVSLMIPGPRALSIDDWQGGRLRAGTLWAQTYFDGRQQWAAANGEPTRDGVYQIATYAPGLSVEDFGEVEFGRLYGGPGAIGYTDVHVAEVAEPSGLGQLLGLGVGLALLRWQRRQGRKSPNLHRR